MIINFLVCPSPYDRLAPLFTILRVLLDYGKIIVPIILIIYGLLDFGKAVVTKDEAEMKKAQLLFVKRVVSGVAIFFVITGISLLMQLLANSFNNSQNSWVNWLDCFYGR